jgi:ATP-dependent RNA helicase RhlE
VDIVVACPGRLLDHLWKGTLNLGDLKILVLDEADRMLDMGFLPDIRSILRCIMKPHQTLLFSATMPDDIHRLAKDILHDPVTVKIGLTVPATTVSHAIYPVAQHLKTGLLKEILKKTETDSVLVFTGTKHRAERVAHQLIQAGFRAASLQGDMPQNQRQAALDGFRRGYHKILVATDIAARGIDILSISHVINYDFPQSVDDYIHRIGRTGRVNQSGDALTLVTSKDDTKVRLLEKILKAPLERRRLPGFDYEKNDPDTRPSRLHVPLKTNRPGRRARKQTSRVK